MLDGLAESGHVERTRSDSDRRVVVARLTPLGRAQVQAKRAAWHERWERALATSRRARCVPPRRSCERLGAVFEEEPARGPARGREGP